MSSDPAIPQVPTPVETLGEIAAPSGAIVCIDAGLLGLWCHDRPPFVEPGEFDEELTAKMNAAVDLAIEGPDAEAAGIAFDRQPHPRFLYDMPADFHEVQALFDDVCRARKLVAGLVPLPQRVTHRRRIDLALEYGRGAGEFMFHGISVVAIAGLPRDRKLPVRGQRMPGDDDPDRWRHVYLECRPNTPVARAELIGSVAVDKARLMFADVDALGEWKHEEPFDGLADVVFWGLDAAALAAEAGAPRRSGSEFGWSDLPVDEAADRALRLQDLRDARGWKLALDFRPHSHHYQMMAQVRSSPTGSGTLAIGPSGAMFCLFRTTWGDGYFPVYRDLASDGSLVRVRVDVGNDQTVEQLRQVLAAAKRPPT
jgi:hypothetical protein